MCVKSFCYDMCDRGLFCVRFERDFDFVAITACNAVDVCENVFKLFFNVRDKCFPPYFPRDGT